MGGLQGGGSLGGGWGTWLGSEAKVWVWVTVRGVCPRNPLWLTPYDPRRVVTGASLGELKESLLISVEEDIPH